VSVRLHDELDLMEDKRNKALEENRHLTEILEITDKKQFRMEMEIDKLRDQVRLIITDNIFKHRSWKLVTSQD
jgi:hypothetical protein